MTDLPTSAFGGSAAAAALPDPDPTALSAAMLALGMFVNQAGEPFNADQLSDQLLKDDLLSAVMGHGGSPSPPLTHLDQAVAGSNAFAPPPGTTAPVAQPSQAISFTPSTFTPSTFTHSSSPGPFDTVAAAGSTSPWVATANLLGGLGTTTMHTAVSMQDHQDHDQDPGHSDAASDDDEHAPVVTAVRVISDQFNAVNSIVRPHELGTNLLTLTYMTSADGDYQAELTVPVKVTTTTAGLVDLKWQAALVPMTKKQIRNCPDLDELVARPDWDALRATGSVVGGQLTQIRDRTQFLDMTFSVVPRKNSLLVIVVNGIVLQGVPKMVAVRCDRHTRRKRKARAQGDQEDVDIDSDSDSDSSPEPVTKRAKIASAVGDQEPVAFSIEHVNGPLTPPPSPHFGPHIRPEVLLMDMIEAARFDPTVHILLKSHQFRFETLDIHRATSLLFALHIRGGANSAWTTAEIVETFALLGVHADLIRQYCWSMSVPYPDPLHALAHCSRPDLVDFMLEYLHPRQVPAPALASCPQSAHVGHNRMVCDHCRAFATNLALSRANGKGYLPIHAAAWKQNSTFVAHHLRIMGANATFAAGNQRDGDGGNFLHATCGSRSAVDWLDKLWHQVIVNEADRKVVVKALLDENDRGWTPLVMAKFQAEKRDETANQTKQRTLAWVQEKIALLA